MILHQWFYYIIAWFPHGYSWKVLKIKAMVANIIPLFFNLTKYEYLMCQLNGWGLEMVKIGTSKGSYYNQNFLLTKNYLSISTIKKNSPYSRKN